MRHDDALRANRLRAKIPPGTPPARAATIFDTLRAMATAAVMIAPAPFFWNPPLWVQVLMQRPRSRGRGDKESRS